MPAQNVAWRVPVAVLVAGYVHQIFAEMAPGDVFYPPKELDREVEDGDQIQEEAARGSIQKPADTDRS